jgi:hypothetical protein
VTRSCGWTRAPARFSLAFLDLGVAGTELAADEEMVWISSVGDGAVVRVDPAARSVVARAAGLDSPRALTVGDQVWVLTRAGLVALERDGLEQAGTVPTGPRSCGLATTPEAVWVSDTEPFLQQVDPATRTVVAAVTTATGSCGDVRVAHGLDMGHRCRRRRPLPARPLTVGRANRQVSTEPAARAQPNHATHSAAPNSESSRHTSHQRSGRCRGTGDGRSGPCQWRIGWWSGRPMAG